MALNPESLPSYLEQYRTLLRKYDVTDAENGITGILDTLSGWTGPDDKFSLVWPERPTCHRGSDIGWRQPSTREPYPVDFRTCSYCGSIHPEDLVRHLTSGARLSGSDWKYGFPHKFYVENVPNLAAGKVVQMGSSSKWEGDVYTEEPIMGAAPAHAPCKWYNDHLEDVTDAPTFLVLAAVVSVCSGIAFWRGEKGLMYAAPRYGYQQW